MREPPQRVQVVPPESDFMLPAALFDRLWQMPGTPAADDTVLAVGLQGNRGRRRFVALRTSRTPR